MGYNHGICPTKIRFHATYPNQTDDDDDAAAADDDDDEDEDEDEPLR